MSKLVNSNTFSIVVASKAAALLLCLFASCFFMRAQEYRAVKDTLAKADTVKLEATVDNWADPSNVDIDLPVNTAS